MATANEASDNLERVTDFVEEKELDSAKMAQAMSGLQSGAASSGEEALPALKANKEHAAFLIERLEITEKEAKTALRRHENDMQRTLRYLMDA